MYAYLSLHVCVRVSLCVYTPLTVSPTALLLLFLLPLLLLLSLSCERALVFVAFGVGVGQQQSQPNSGLWLEFVALAQRLPEISQTHSLKHTYPGTFTHSHIHIRSPAALCMRSRLDAAAVVVAVAVSAFFLFPCELQFAQILFDYCGHFLVDFAPLVRQMRTWNNNNNFHSREEFTIKIAENICFDVYYYY